jgi:protein arginine N-methyltransferase 1
MVKEDCAFTAPFELECTRNDYIHALVVYFDVDFGACHKQCGFSTSPASRTTHWKQTVFYLNEAIVVNEGEKLTGMISTK